MGELGQTLRAAREAKGLSLAQAEQDTRIRRAFLEALEDERYDVLPGLVYTKGFIRNYALYLGLDPQECLAAFGAGAGEGAKLPEVLSEPLLPSARRHGRHTAKGVLLALLLILVGATAWYSYNHFVLGEDPWPISQVKGFLGASATPLAPAATSTPAPTAGAQTPTAVVPTGAPTGTPTPFTPTPSAEPASATPTRSATRTAIPTATPAPITATPTVRTYEGVYVELTVLQVCYVRVEVDGVMVLEKNLNPGEDQVWTARERFSMRIGNAGGVTLRVNGVEVKDLGAEGQIVDVAYTPDTLPH